MSCAVVNPLNGRDFLLKHVIMSDWKNKNIYHKLRKKESNIKHINYYSLFIHDTVTCAFNRHNIYLTRIRLVKIAFRSLGKYLWHRYHLENATIWHQFSKTCKNQQPLNNTWFISKAWLLSADHLHLYIFKDFLISHSLHNLHSHTLIWLLNSHL